MKNYNLRMDRSGKMASHNNTPRSNRLSSDTCNRCCSSHSYLCPHRSSSRVRAASPPILTGRSDNLKCKLLRIWDCYKAHILAFAVLLSSAVLGRYIMNQHDLVHEMQCEMQRLKELVASQESFKSCADIPGPTCEQPKDNDLVLRSIIKSEIDAYDADKIARVDYALESAGGRILSILNTKPYVSDQSVVSKVWSHVMTMICKDGHADTARPILQPKMAPGECWAFEGAQGAVIIKLLTKIYVSGITIEHIPAAISPSPGITSAPKVFNLWGLKSKDDSNAFLFGEFKYKNDSKPVQYYRVKHRSDTPYDIVLLKILSNWGNQQYTCIYRVRIHGDLDKKDYKKKEEVCKKESNDMSPGKLIKEVIDTIAEAGCCPDENN